MTQLFKRYPRYQEKSPSPLSGYHFILDRSTQCKSLGRKVPASFIFPQALKWITQVKHFGLFPVFFRVRSEDSWRTVSPNSQGLVSLYPGTIARISLSDLSKSFFNYLWGADFLFRHGYLIRQFSVKHLLFDEKNQGRLGYLEEIIPLDLLDKNSFQGAFNWAYFPPESLENQVFNESSLEYYLGQILIHALSGSPHHRSHTEEDHFLSGIHVKKEWKAILWKMTSQREADRCGWDYLLKESARLAGHSRRNLPGVRLFHNHKTIFSRISNVPTRRGAVIQTGPGRESVSIRNQLLDWAEEHGYLFLHLWQEGPSKAPFESINQLIDLVRGRFLEENRFNASIENLPHLSNWKSDSENRGFWKPIVEEFKRVLFTRSYRGIVFEFEDLHHMDVESIAAFCTLLSWLKDDPVLFVVSTPFFLDKNLMILMKHLALHCHIYKPEPVSIKTLFQMTDGFQRGRMKTHYEQIHHRTVGNKTLLMRELQKEGGALSFLEGIWKSMKPAWQRFFSLLSCAYAPMLPGDIRRFIGWDSLPAPDLLERLGLIQFDSIRGYSIGIPMLRSFCQKQIDPETRALIRQKLLENAETDGLNSTCLRWSLGEHPATLSGAIEEILRAPLGTWSRLFESGELNEFDEKSTVALRNIIRLWHGRSTGVSVTGPASQFKHYQKGLELEKSGHRNEAAQAYKKSSAQRGVPFLLRARSIVKALRCLAGLRDATGLARLINQFDELQWPERDLQLKPFYAAMIQGLGLSFPRINTWGTGTWQNWPKANDAWRGGDYNKCLHYLEKLLARLPVFMDDMEAGDVYKLYGNALYKNNHPNLASKAYVQAQSHYQSCEHHESLRSILFNLASTEKLAGNLLTSMKYFHEILFLYRQDGDLKSESQVVFNLMEIALLRGQNSTFEELYQQHRTLIGKTHDEEERIRGLIVGLFSSLKRPRFLVQEAVIELNERMKKFSGDPLILEEVHLAIRLASLRLHKPCLQVRREGTYTKWRHRFLDYLLGESSTNLGEILTKEEFGFFKGLFIQLVSDSIDEGYLPVGNVPPYFLKTIQEYCQRNKAGFFTVLQAKLSAEGIQENNQGSWDFKQHLELLKHVYTDPLDETLMNLVLSELNAFWPCSTMGKTGTRLSLFQPDGDSLPVFLVNHIKHMKEQHCDVPFIRSWFSPNGESCEYLFIMFESTTFWFKRKGVSAPSINPMRLRFFQEYFSVLMTREKNKKTDISSRSVGSRSTPDIPDMITSRFIGESNSVRDLKKKILLFGKSSLGVHIAGESGTGKELVARLLHDVSPRIHKGFRAINCCDFSENLIQSELFGHVKGAFTGAERDRVGLVEQINGGTLFLDEIGDLTPKVQSMLLRFIQEKEFTPVGGNRLKKVDVRVITATNKSLQELMDRGVFREDLFFRIAETELFLPPLRSRPSDLNLLVPFLIKKHASGRKIRLTQSFFAQLKAHSWRGNVRELENYLKKMLVMYPDAEEFLVDQMPEFLKTSQSGDDELLRLETWEDKNRKQFIQQRLTVLGGNRTRTAQSLGISRQQLIRLIHKYDLT